MAKFHATVVFIALLSFAVVSLARTPPDNDDSTAAFSLPLDSEKTKSDEPSTTVPLTKLDTFQPVNRRFDVGSTKRRPCHHHITRFYPDTREQVEVSYGNDMILATASSGEVEEPVVHHGGQRVVRIHHHHHDEDSDNDSNSDDDEDEDRIRKMVVSRRYGRLNGEKLNMLKIYRAHERHHHKKGGFINHLRKFLDRYF